MVQARDDARHRLCRGSTRAPSVRRWINARTVSSTHRSDPILIPAALPPRTSPRSSPVRRRAARLVSRPVASRFGVSSAPCLVPVPRACSPPTRVIFAIAASFPASSRPSVSPSSSSRLSSSSSSSFVRLLVARVARTAAGVVAARSASARIATNARVVRLASRARALAPIARRAPSSRRRRRDANGRGRPTDRRDARDIWIDANAVIDTARVVSRTRHVDTARVYINHKSGFRVQRRTPDAREIATSRTRRGRTRVSVCYIL